MRSKSRKKIEGIADSQLMKGRGWFSRSWKNISKQRKMVDQAAVREKPGLALPIRRSQQMLLSPSNIIQSTIRRALRHRLRKRIKQRQRKELPGRSGTSTLRSGPTKERKWTILIQSPENHRWNSKRAAFNGWELNRIREERTKNRTQMEAK